MGDREAIAVAALTLVLFVGSPVIASQSNTSFAAYGVSIAGPKVSHTAVVNESIGGSDKLGFSDLVLQIVSGQQNFTDSRLVNSSRNYFPFLNNLATQSLDYTNGTNSGFHASVSGRGTSSVTFGGNHYTLSVYSIEIGGRYGNRTFSVNGTVETFPSSLVYSVDMEGKTFTLNAVLLKTNLQLEQTTQTAPTAVYVGAGLSLGGLAIVATLVVKRREQKTQPKEDKPPHWVD
jgi:hypothetical protein